MVMLRRKEERRAKVAGTCVIADGKFQPSGISGKVTGEGHAHAPVPRDEPAEIQPGPA